MGDGMKQVLQNMRDDHARHLERLKRWKQAGGDLQNYPEEETIDDFIEREERAIRNLEGAIARLE